MSQSGRRMGGIRGVVLVLAILLFIAGAVLFRSCNRDGDLPPPQVAQVPQDPEPFPFIEGGSPFLEIPQGVEYDLSRDWQIIGFAPKACPDGSDEGAFLHLPSDTRIIACCIDPDLPIPQPQDMFRLEGDTLIPERPGTQRFRYLRTTQP